jgi:nitroimidazol reductase NimA-like FMN-containing flavoprotein (pyridoxamine 5'-phosphate oxidase superfamily)
MSSDRAISTDEEAVIERHDGVAHVATATDDRPHVAPVFYCYEAGAVYFITGGKKLENLRENPRVAIGLYERVGDHPESVRQAMVLGRAIIIENNWERIKHWGDAIRRKYYGETNEEWPSRESMLVCVEVGSVVAADQS